MAASRYVSTTLAARRYVTARTRSRQMISTTLVARRYVMARTRYAPNDFHYSGGPPLRYGPHTL